MSSAFGMTTMPVLWTFFCVVATLREADLPCVASSSLRPGTQDATRRRDAVARRKITESNVPRWRSVVVGFVNERQCGLDDNPLALFPLKKGNSARELILLQALPIPPRFLTDAPVSRGEFSLVAVK